MINFSLARTETIGRIGIRYRNDELTWMLKTSDINARPASKVIAGRFGFLENQG
jgi:hypothetical protein